MYNKIYKIIMISLLVSIFANVTLFATENDKLDREIEAAIRMLGERPSWSSKATLEQFQPEDVVPVLVFAINNNPAYREGASRSLAYSVLLSLGAARLPEGLEQFIIGLQEPKVSIECARALVNTSIKNRLRVVDALEKVLVDEKSERNLLFESLQTLTKLLRTDLVTSKQKLSDRKPHPAISLLKRIEHIFATGGDDVSLRWAAAYAMMTIGGIEKTLPHFHATIDKPGRKAILFALNRHGTETKGTFAVNFKLRTELRGIVIDALQSEELDLRKTALESILGVFGDEIYVELPEGFDINPILLHLLETTADNEENPELRNNLFDIINHLPQTLLWKNAQRRVRNEE